MFEKQSFPGGMRLRFSATLPLLDRAVDETVRFVTGQNASGSLFDVKLLLREALLNAVVHGSRSDPERHVSLEVRAFEGRLTLVVTDQGPGFDWRAGLASMAPPEATSGRGLTILTLYADDVRYNAAGNAVTLAKAVPGLRGPAAAPEDGDNIQRSTDMDDIRIEDGTAVVSPAGDIVASVADALRARFKELLQEHPGGLVIDLARVELIDSVGIGLLIAVHNTLGKKGGRLVLRNVNPDLAALLRTMRLDKHFQVETAS
ncbi:anti-sigma-factor antagonist [Solidesulfovibrio fructosivorans JJ]]|uniref:Anti-sigma-factor antagonist n=1 Tax=Solidesulfovibrio fructosivorans JJ] TaxID=596151 RepID=E1K1K4_SOLFR|nr:ATP-binding protein [Solidesulfovibrio fructosivorans]EFL49498.1 anti-sigma-factor antagonist [Solidesulfovibrio fructosivorans JJ]]